MVEKRGQARGGGIKSSRGVRNGTPSTETTVQLRLGSGTEVSLSALVGWLKDQPMGKVRKTPSPALYLCDRYESMSEPPQRALLP